MRTAALQTPVTHSVNVLFHMCRPTQTHTLSLRLGKFTSWLCYLSLVSPFSHAFVHSIALPLLEVKDSMLQIYNPGTFGSSEVKVTFPGSFYNVSFSFGLGVYLHSSFALSVKRCGDQQ